MKSELGLEVLIYRSGSLSSPSTGAWNAPLVLKNPLLGTYF